MRARSPDAGSSPWAAIAAWTAASADENAAAMPSPNVENTMPPNAATVSRKIVRCRSRRSDMSADVSHSIAEDSMSVNR